MSSSQLTALVAGAIVGAVLAAASLRRWLRSSEPASLVRTNVGGREVPVVLGGPVIVGGIGGLAAADVTLLLLASAVPLRLSAALVIVLLVLYGAGAWDDRRGDERPRGFSGHLGAARGGRLTGGLVKLIAGLAAGGLAGAIIATGWGVLETALLVALGANSINLFDRAPGRAGKVALMVLLPLAALGAPVWSVAAAGSIAALLVALPFDLRERAMLGDAGANPIGGVLGLGLAASLPEWWRIFVVLLLLALNLASERWSFSRVIARVPLLDAFDRIGRG